MRLRDHGAWPGISQYSISHLALFYLASRIFCFTSRNFYSYLAFLSRVSLFFNLASRIFLSRNSHLPSEFFSSLIKPVFSRVKFTSVLFLLYWSEVFSRVNLDAQKQLARTSVRPVSRMARKGRFQKRMCKYNIAILTKHRLFFSPTC